MILKRVDLLIDNLIIEYIGVEEFVAFAAANARSIGVLACVIQQSNTVGFVSLEGVGASDYVAVPDSWSSHAMTTLADGGGDVPIVSGESAAAGLRRSPESVRGPRASR